MWQPFQRISDIPFHHHYLPARQAFLDAVDALARTAVPVEHQVLPYPLNHSPVPLATDLVWLGPPDASHTLVLISGTHGVEGFCGSAIQTDFLRHLAQAGPWPTTLRCLLVHALNPFGMQWWRRCDAWGIDLNRNFVDFSQPLPDNAPFLALLPALNDSDHPRRHQAFADFVVQHGQTAFEQAISGGQYLDPHGAFYGGTGPSPSRQLIDHLLAQEGMADQPLLVLDIHTGLGPFGYGELICDHAPDCPQAALARHIFGATVTLPALGTSSSVPKAGLMDYAWHRVMNERSCFLTLEYGSYGTTPLFDVILDDHILHRSAALDDSLFSHPVKQTMREHFCPDSRLWEQLVLAQARIHINTALEALQA